MATLPLKYLTYKDDHNKFVDLFNNNIKLLDWGINHGQLDGNNISSKYIYTGELQAEQIVSGRIDANTVVIDNLAVGENVAFGENVIISWDQINTDLANPVDIGAMAINPGAPTTIGSNWLYTGTLTAQQINAVNGIVLGANASITWNALPTLPTAGQIGARPDNWFPTATEVGARPNTWVPTAAEVGARADTWLPTPAQINAVVNTQAAVFNTLSNNGAVAGMWLSGGQLYINADYIDSGTISADIVSGGTLQGIQILTTPNAVGSYIQLTSNAPELRFYRGSTSLRGRIYEDSGTFVVRSDGDGSMILGYTGEFTYPRGVWDFNGVGEVRNFPSVYAKFS